MPLGGVPKVLGLEGQWGGESRGVKPSSLLPARAALTIFVYFILEKEF